MTVGGWVFMIVAWGAVISLAVSCYIKLMRHRH